MINSSINALKQQELHNEDTQLVRKWAPTLRFDVKEPFFPSAIGYTVIEQPMKSPSSKFDLDPQGGTIIEYAIWWDWDIQHLYELEHVWVYLSADGDLIQVESSAHGNKLLMADEDLPLPLEDGRITLYSESGKHGLGLHAEWMTNIKTYTDDRCGKSAGSGGIHTGNPFGAEKFGNPTPLDHRLAKRYMQRLAFEPTYNFSKIVDLRDLVFVTWDILAEWIPKRIIWWQSELRRTVPHLQAICLDCGDTIADEGTEIKDEDDVALSADLIPNAKEMVLDLSSHGYSLALVADGPRGTFVNILNQHGLWDVFDTYAISGEVGKLKPEAIMFTTALDALNIDKDDYPKVVMVGNNLARDIKGANDLGLISIWLSWSPRRSHTPANDSEIPQHTIQTPDELLPLLEQIELSLPIQED